MLSEVYDIEVLSNLFTYTGYCRQTQTFHQFVIHSSRNDYIKLMEHLHRDELIMIGYNNDSYDYPIIHHMINHYEEYKNLSGYELAQLIYAKSQEVIGMDFSTVADWNKHIKQIDLFKIWHYDNTAKLTSLKNLEVAMNLPLVEDMPFEHYNWIKAEDIPLVLSYNKNDVVATNEFLNITQGQTELPLYKGKNKIQLRYAIAHKFKLNGMNFNDIKLGTELILKLYCERFNKKMAIVRKMKTPRPLIHLKDCLPQWMEFKTNKFKGLVDKFSNTYIHNGETKGKVDYSLIYHGIKIFYGTGGAHACIKPGVYDSDEEYGIYDVDIDSLYPSLAITQGLYPEHLGPEWIDIYDGEIVSVRVAEKHKPKSERDFVIVEGFKLAANGSYGKTNEEKSWLYDPLYAMKTTVSGQIFISMWAEYICENIPNCTILQINTDGITFRFPKKYKDDLIKLSDEITSKCKLTYELNEYRKMVIKDVNNYSSQYVDGKIKHKGDFEIDKELHKDPSMRIVSIAMEKYFFKDIPVNETVKNHTNIYDFCLRLRTNKDSVAQYVYLGPNGLAVQNLSKTTRYYISNQGGALQKRFVESEKINGVNVGYVTTIFNKYEEKPMEEYDINYQFYISEAKKIINQIEDNQLSLF